MAFPVDHNYNFVPWFLHKLETEGGVYLLLVLTHAGKCPVKVFTRM